MSAKWNIPTPTARPAFPLHGRSLPRPARSHRPLRQPRGVVGRPAASVSKTVLRRIRIWLREVLATANAVAALLVTTVADLLIVAVAALALLAISLLP